MNWMTGLQRAIDYVEEHILENLDLESIAAQSFSSSYHFQRVFSMTFITAMSWRNGTGSIFLTMRSRVWILWKAWRWRTLSCLSQLI